MVVCIGMEVKFVIKKYDFLFVLNTLILIKLFLFLKKLVS